MIKDLEMGRFFWIIQVEGGPSNHKDPNKEKREAGKTEKKL